MSDEQQISDEAHGATTLPTVYQAVATATALCTIALKDKQNTYDNYSYRSIEAVMNAVHMAMATAGVIVCLHDMRDLQRLTAETKKGGTEILIVFTGVFRVYGPRGDHFEVLHYCEGMDRRDKGGNKAVSAGYKDVLQKLFTLPFGDELPEDTPAEGNRAIKGEPQQSEPPKRMGPKPWEYQHADGILRVVPGKAVAEVRASSLDVEQLETALRMARDRADAMQEKQFADALSDAVRDIRVISHWIDTKHMGAGLDRPQNHKPDKGQKDLPLKDSKPVKSEPAASEKTSEAEKPPGPALKAAVRVPRLTIETTPDVISTSKKLNKDEISQLCLLTPWEVAGILLHADNAVLFNAIDAASLQRHDTTAAPLLSGEWFARAWYETMESDKRRMSARKIARLAIKGLELAKRGEDLEAGKVIDIELRDITTAERAVLAGYISPLADAPACAKALSSLAPDTRATAEETTDA